jgi:3-oxoacyl-[acyl-carrier-protein] synthase III
MNTQITHIDYYLPEKILTNAELHEGNPAWDMKLVAERAGVLERHIAADGETALDLAVRACQQLFTKNPGLKEQAQAVIFCTQSEDYIMPPNSCLMHKHLALGENVFAFDINSACSGYVHGLALARGIIHSGLVNNVLLINADTYSKYIHPQDRSARVLFGDGAAASWIEGTKDRGIVDMVCATSGKDFDKFIIPAGGCRIPRSAETARLVTNSSGNIRTDEHIHMDGLGVLGFVNSKVPPQVRAILEKNKLTTNDIDLFVFHQASKMVLDSLTRLLKLDPQKVFSNIAATGNTVSASIPIALKQAQEAGRIQPGDRVLISGFGVGLSWATAIIDF